MRVHEAVGRGPWACSPGAVRLVSPGSYSTRSALCITELLSCLPTRSSHRASLWRSSGVTCRPGSAPSDFHFEKHGNFWRECLVTSRDCSAVQGNTFMSCPVRSACVWSWIATVWRTTRRNTSCWLQRVVLGNPRLCEPSLAQSPAAYTADGRRVVCSDADVAEVKRAFAG